jgi:membrane-bound serine protease (ClpP class)
LVLRDGKIIKLESEDQIYKEGEHPDVVISPKGKLLTLNAEQLMQYKVADALLLPQALEPITEEEESQGKWSLAKSPFSQIAFFKNMEPCEISTFSMDWQTRFMAFLALPQVSSLLFLAMVICFYLEMNSPGVTLPAVVGTLCLFFIILSSFALQAVHWLEPILFFFGVFLALAEIFVLPTAGILAVLGGLFMLVGLLGMMIPGFDAIHFEGSNLNAAGEYVLSRLGWFSGALLIAAVVVIILSRYVKPRVNFFKRIVLQDTELLQTGVHRMQAEENVPHTKVTVGDFAHVAVTLRPAGKIVVTTSFGALEIDAQSTGAFIEKGSKVHVVKIEGEKIFVE